MIVLTAIGLMTGSSMDGIDAAIIQTDGKSFAKHIDSSSLDYTPEFRLKLRTAEYALQITKGDLIAAEENFQTLATTYLSEINSSSLAADSLASIIKELTLLHVKLVRSLIKKANFTSQDIDVLGFHGQNLYHNPSSFLTIQIGDGQLLADETKIFVVNNFRLNDVKNGGQGAPFAPLYHQVLAEQTSLSTIAIVNCGGISNITLIDKGNNQLIGFDIGPGNVLIDQYVRKYTENKEFMDKDGQYGSKGEISHTTLELLKTRSLANYAEDFLKKLPPKSLDTRHFTLIKELDELKFEDACATLEAFTAKCIVDSLDLIKTKPPKLWVPMTV